MPRDAEAVAEEYEPAIVWVKPDDSMLRPDKQAQIVDQTRIALQQSAEELPFIDVSISTSNPVLHDVVTDENPEPYLPVLLWIRGTGAVCDESPKGMYYMSEILRKRVKEQTEIPFVNIQSRRSSEPNVAAVVTDVGRFERTRDGYVRTDDA